MEKAFYASYLNMATCNIDAIFCHINHKFYPANEIKVVDGIKALKGLSIIKELETGSDTVKQLKIIKEIEKYLPFLKTLFDITPKEEIQEATPKDKIVTIIIYIELLFDLRNYNTHIAHKEISIPNIKGKLNMLFNASVNTVKERFALGEKEVLHLRRKIGKRENTKFYYKIFETDGGFSHNGLLFFTSLFLEKKYAFLLLKQNTGFKDSRDIQKKATLNTYTVHCAILPKERLDSEETPITLGMDMANEIYKCPQELFDLLDTKDQNRFRVPLSESIKQDASNEILKIRHTDRFPYFALRYLDMQESFKSIFFHIDMGSYFFDKYEKSLIDGTTLEDRRLSKRILCFEKMQNAIETYKREKDTALYKAKEEGKDIYQNDTYPHYHINNNQIGIKLASFYPKLEGKETKSESPDAWLSLYELPLIAYLCLNKKNWIVEQEISSYIQRCRAFFQYVSDGKAYNESSIEKDFKLNKKDLPIIFFKERDYTGLTKKFIERMVLKTEKIKQNYLNEQKYQFKLGQKSKPQYKSGYIAQLLVEDFMLFQPSNMEGGKDKITAPNYQALQAALALYSKKKDNLPRIMQQAGLVGSDNPHPFLNECIDSSNSIGGFFTNYLAKKIAYLNSLLKDEQQLKEAYFLRYYIKKQSLTLQEEQIALAKELLNLPINLPRGLFKKYFNCKKENNPSFFIHNELDSKGDKVQSFYTYNRNYDYIKSIKREYGQFTTLREIKPKEDDDIKLKKEFNKFEKNEKLLRYRSTCDIVLFYMAKELLGIKDTLVKLSLVDSNNNFILNQTHTLSENYKIKATSYTIKGSMKIKNYGNFKRLLFDKRLKTFLPYFEANTSLTYDYIEGEFAKYDLMRIELFRALHTFEEKEIKEKGLTLGKENYIDFPNITNNQELINLRNTFCHHEYPKGLTITENGNITLQIITQCKELFREKASNNQVCNDLQI